MCSVNIKENHPEPFKVKKNAKQCNELDILGTRDCVLTIFLIPKYNMLISSKPA